MTDNLTPSLSNRGFKQMPEVEGRYGGTIKAFESSAAFETQVWVKVRVPDDANSYLNHPDEYIGKWYEATILLKAEDAKAFSEQLSWLVENHYHND